MTFSNKVPHAAPLQNGEGPCNYVAGWNMPGYLPVTDPEAFSEFDDAKRYILNSMGEHADEEGLADNEAAAENIEDARQDVNLVSRPFSVTVEGLAYWVEKVG